MQKYSKTIRTAIIGLGKICHAYEDDPLIIKDMKYPTHFSVLREHPGFELIAGSDSIESKRKTFSRKAGSSVVLFEKYEEMILRCKPDMLIITTDTSSHYDISITAMELGVKGILCEKPLTYSLQQAKKIVQYGIKNKVFFAVNYFRAFDTNYNKILVKVKNMAWGQLHGIDGKYCGGIYNNGTHLIDLILRCAGEPKVVYGFPPKFFRKDEQDPIINLYIQFHQGVTSYLRGFTSKDYDIFELEFFFSKGTLSIRADKPTLYISKPSQRVSNIEELSEVKGDIHIDIGTSFYDVYDNLYECFINNKHPLCTAEDALKALQVADSGIRSIK